jgi:hypothetical protein
MTVRYDPCRLHGRHPVFSGTICSSAEGNAILVRALSILSSCSFVQQRVSPREVQMSGIRASGGVLTIILATAAPVFAQQQPSPAGHVKIASGSASIIRGDATLAARPGQPVFATDTLRTGGDGKVGVTLRDDTRLSLGPNSEVRIERYVYAPAEGGFGMVLNFVRGVAAYVSGRIAKLAPDSIRLETPAAIVGVRGTTVAVRVEP